MASFDAMVTGKPCVLAGFSGSLKVVDRMKCRSRILAEK
jgi:hypothetical protein